MEAITLIELDLDYCALRFGETTGGGTCPAVLGVDSEAKCFNTLKTCAVREAFLNQPHTYRFTTNSAGVAESGIDAIPNLLDVSFTPGTISLGKDLGTRSSLSAVFGDHKWSDAAPGFDKYVADRDFDPYEQGTFWGKFRARHPFVRGRPIRIIRGFVGQSLDEMETRHFIIDSFDGPTPDGKYTITAKDALKLADGDRAQAPRQSNGFLVAAIDNNDTSITLSPSGIGNAEYPASDFYVSIGGNEIVHISSRSGDVLTISQRGRFGTTATDHDQQDRVQLCLHYAAVSPDLIIADLLTNYAGVPVDYIPAEEWASEIAAFNRRVYTALIAEPESVNALVSELIEQAALAVWWDDIERRIRLRVLRAIPTSAETITPDIFLTGSLRTREQPGERISRVRTYFGHRNPLLKLDDPTSFRSAAMTVDLQNESDYGSPSIHDIFSRWIPAFGRTIAQRVNDIQLGRFKEPPRRFNFDIFRQGTSLVPILGDGYRLEGWPLQNDDGSLETVPIQITRLNPLADRFGVEAEEMRFALLDPEDLANRVIIIDTNTLNFSLRAVHDTLYPAPEIEDDFTLTVIVEAGVIVGSSSVNAAAFHAGNDGQWPDGVKIIVRVVGRIQGKGGRGGSGIPSQDQNGQAGGPGLYTRTPIWLDIQGGEVWGGGGGGGAGIAPGPYGLGGGGGQGQIGGSAGNGHPNWPATAGTPDAPGQPGHALAGMGGMSGQPGMPGNYGLGGAGGLSIDGVEHVTFGTGEDDPPPPPAAIVKTFVGTLTKSGTATTQNLGNVTVPEDGLLVFAVSGVGAAATRQIVSATVAGNAAERIIRTGPIRGPSAFFSAPVTAGSRNIQVTFNGNVGHARCEVWLLENVISSEPYQAINPSWGFSMDIPAGGVGLAFSSLIWTNIASLNWTGVSRDSQGKTADTIATSGGSIVTETGLFGLSVEPTYTLGGGATTSFGQSVLAVSFR